ncbi:tRNA pseudouridine synthase B [Candidatus Protochlamydia naegleriophila]|uniref:tRNA pseudouridine synthase B n=1 Tax=Candidatus Protochlamydia naegleriophila TaxID=389348 RepID=A0A0U5JEG3_9BACT|nr:tRNA pseudouridine(55) synthase TruB [Candidatus Protochlamydia naegleriophila]CUI16978.1 tRNA pseudouridine synthase B [Candidatus Protochlamydia naegleriophila]
MTNRSPSAPPPAVQGILLINKPKGKTSFSLVRELRKLLNVKKIGHAGTLDPFATGVMVMLIGRDYTRLSDRFLLSDKEYVAQVHLGIVTDTYDCEGQILSRSEKVPSVEEIQQALTFFQGEIEQIPPMFSAKKKQGKKLYELARQGIEIEREPVKINVQTELLSFTYPYLELRIKCSKGTYIRSLAYDLGQKLGCGAHLSNLTRTRSGNFLLENCIDGTQLQEPTLNLAESLIHLNN